MSVFSVPMHSAPCLLLHVCISPPGCVDDSMSTLILWPPYCCLPWYDPPSSPSFCQWGRDPVLLIVPGTGAPSPHPHCSRPLAALRLHLFTPFMSSLRPQLSHTVHYPNATHHPSKLASIRLSQVIQCDFMPPTLPPMCPQSQPAVCMVGPMHEILFWFVKCVCYGFFSVVFAVIFQCPVSWVHHRVSFLFHLI